MSRVLARVFPDVLREQHPIDFLELVPRDHGDLRASSRVKMSLVVRKLVFGISDQV